MDSDDNWPDAQILSCPGCGTQLFAVDHSPYSDDHRLYCDRCPQAIEIRFYDPDYRRALAQLPAQHTWEQIMTAIEPLLRPCGCGGRFGGHSPRRCFACVVAIPAAAHKDLSPYTGGPVYRAIHRRKNRPPTIDLKPSSCSAIIFGQSLAAAANPVAPPDTVVNARCQNS